MAKQYVVVRQVGKRKHVYLGVNKGEPQYASWTEVNKIFSTHYPQTYTAKTNASRRAKELRLADSHKYFEDDRRKIGTFDVVEAPVYW